MCSFHWTTAKAYVQLLRACFNNHLILETGVSHLQYEIKYTLEGMVSFPGGSGCSRGNPKGVMQGTHGRCARVGTIVSQKLCKLLFSHSPRASLWQLGFSKVSILVYHLGSYPAARAVALPSDLCAGDRYLYNNHIQRYWVPRKSVRI